MEAQANPLTSLNRDHSLSITIKRVDGRCSRAMFLDGSMGRSASVGLFDAATTAWAAARTASCSEPFVAITPRFCLEFATV